MTKEIIGAQGEITIIKVSSLPNVKTKPAVRVAKGFIISHSENGNHHLLTGGEVMERVENVPQGMKILHAILDDPQQLIQDAAAPHGGYDLMAGFYEFRISREYDPFAEEARIVAD